MTELDAGARTMSRRQALKRGAVVGGTLVWAVPAVQAINMTQAEAASAPPGRPHGNSAGGRPAGNLPPQAQPGGLASTGTPVIATAAVGTGLLIGGAAVTVAIKAGATGVASAVGGAGGTGAAGATGIAGAAESAAIPPPPV
jgi:hypothetical protein